MWTKWVTIHQSYGVPRVAQEFIRYLEIKGVRVRLTSRQTRRSGHVYALQVPDDQRQAAEELLRQFKKSFS
jgi:predicted secreted acid phosphatase